MLLTQAGRRFEIRPPLTALVHSAPRPLRSRVAKKPGAPLKNDRTEVPAIRLLDQLARAERRHPNLASAYRALRQPNNGPGHWRHYVDPWSDLPPALRPLRVQMNFATWDVRGYAAAAAPPSSTQGRLQERTRSGRTRARSNPQRRIQYSRDREWNKTRGVNEMRLSLFAPAPSSFTFQVRVPVSGVLQVGTGVAANGPPGEVFFEVLVSGRGINEQRLHRVGVQRPQRHQWRDHRVDLARFAGREVRLTLRTTGPKGAFAFWSNPTIWRGGAAAPGRNIVFVLIDTLRADALQSTGGRYPVTPTIDGLAATGAVFTQATALASWTRPSMVSMFTSEHVGRLSRYLGRASPFPKYHRRKLYRRWPRLLTRHLRRQGYWTEAIGNNFYLPGFTRIGFDRSYDRVTDIRNYLHDTPAVTRGALRFLRAHQRRPFFLYLHYDGPHLPYLAPKGYRVRGQRAPGAPHNRVFERYLAAARWVDDNLAAIIEELKRLSLNRKTVVVVTADHGEIFSSAHDHVYRSNYRTRHKHGRSLYQEVLHVPLVITAPGVIPPGRQISDPMSQLDLAPTLLDLAGLPPMKGSMGRSLKTHLLAGTRLPPHPIISETREQMSLRLGRWKYLYRYGGAKHFRDRGGRGPMRRIVDELYDLMVDPHETRNVASRHPDRVRRMRKKLLDVLSPKPSANLGKTQP
jgi:arylsulfatase A-like enzyme